MKNQLTNLQPAALVESTIRQGQGQLSSTGALVIKTGKFTGRSPKDRFIVDEPLAGSLCYDGSLVAIGPFVRGQTVNNCDAESRQNAGAGDGPGGITVPPGPCRISCSAPLR